ncbi:MULTISPECIES: acyl-ACP--UDP-N-acetylglucosamine O-acyltransferase [Roseivirga]|jgi:UDP-N-acetylglucosamine acyltransferase|uniref:Acyl-[acyl-carrier-protein]--UDP-N-acetylglucosamine O-acyltransferase n=1 Tax=Roseivirga thermotolerans TaxID=1758176 RepID=A0ABQ3I6W6_9BACT|nr:MULTISPECIES: acyl-ACP--UDP-N-acetylglucosamine O-acyltransferase [Roseivirga]MEC7753210.1 acyl-ACP--UDP-N-acetylglucosamine O-acyltransferase [Bacteroidota bacterium]GHE59369.1 acyl-[acyl-carrier-protein]--UDP-N-acetylglucosamine O-acyltransferase [Roseivirga thermotolerans]|tara:strand:+ start:25337 stop:26119 length:783 start_codon:yes stop_codon:yes gene_type:complete
MNQPLAYIHPEAKIARNVVIEPFVTISKNVVIEEGTWIGSNVTIMEGARIGKNVKIFPGAVVSAIPQDLKFGGEDTVLEVGDNTVIRECVTLNRGTDATNKTVIGKNCLIMAYTHVAHDCIIGDNCILVNAVQLAGHVTIDDWAIVGGAAAVHQFVNIGAHTMVSGGSLVRKDVPPYTKAGREPLSYAGINSIGLRRRGFSNEKIAEIQEIYRYIFLKGLNNSKALDLVELEMTPSKERDEIINFFRNSDRGVMKGYSAK